MKAFRTLLVASWALLATYTALVIADHGGGLFGVFFGDMHAMGWPGQFNLDFTILLALSGLWVGWRHGFSAAGLLLGLSAFFGGALFLTAYLFVVSVVAKGDVEEILLGKDWASGAVRARSPRPPRLTRRATIPRAGPGPPTRIARAVLAASEYLQRAPRGVRPDRRGGRRG